LGVELKVPGQVPPGDKDITLVIDRTLIFDIYVTGDAPPDPDRRLVAAPRQFRDIHLDITEKRCPAGQQIEEAPFTLQGTETIGDLQPLETRQLR